MAEVEIPEKGWYYATTIGGDSEKIEATRDELKTAVKEGKLLPSSLVWREPMIEWVPFDSLGPLYTYVTGNEPPPSWMYVDPSSGQSVGPLSRHALISLVQKGLIGATTLVVNSKQQTWQEVQSIPEFQAVLPPPELLPTVPANAVWLYVDRANNTREGPVSDTDIVLLHTSAQIDENTLIWKEGMGEWKKLRDIEELKKKLKPVAKREEANDDEDNNGKNNKKNQKKKREEEKKAIESNAVKKEEEKKFDADGKEIVKKKKKNKSKKGKWVQKEDHANVYVEGLPPDITEAEMYAFFKRCGVIVTDLKTEKPRIKIYKNEDGTAKGSGLVTYVKPECVNLALQYLDDADIRPNVKVKVTKAVFEMKGTTFQPKSKGDAKAFKTKKAKFNTNKDLTWADEEGEEVGLRIVILKGMFTLQEVAQADDPDSFYEELQAEVKQECEQKAGEVDKAYVFKNNPDGVISIKFKTAVAAAECIKIFNGRFFACRQISCEYWDGVSNYKVEENEETTKARLEAFGSWLEGEEPPPDKSFVRQNNQGSRQQEEEEEEDNDDDEQRVRARPDAYEAESDIDRIQENEGDNDGSKEKPMES